MKEQSAKQVSIPAPAGLARPLALLCGYAVMVAALIGYAVVSGDRRYTEIGDSYPGALTAIGEPVAQFTATLCAALCLGGLLYIVVTARPDRGVIDPAAFRIHRFTELVSIGWVVSATAMIFVRAASDAGMPVLRLLGDGGVLIAINASETARGWAAAAACALIVAIALRLSVRWVAHCVLLLPALIGVIAAPVTGNAGQGPDHDLSTSAVIVFAIALAALIGLKTAAFIGRPNAAPARRVLLLQVVCGGVAIVYGLQLFLLLARPTDSDYGRLGIAAAVVLVAVWLTDTGLWITSRTSPRIGVYAGVAAAFAAVAAVSSMAIQTAPRLLAHEFSAWDVFLGYQLPQPPDVLRLATVWRFDSLIGVAAVVFAGLYVAGVVRLRRRGDSWSIGRTLAWVAGCLVLLVTSSSGIKAYGSAMFSVHMAEHMTLNMFVPVLLVLGGPLTLALRALPAAAEAQPPGPREWLQWLVHSRPTALLSHPITAFVLFVGSLYAVYFTRLFDTFVRYHWGHELMSIHFLLVGYLFFWGIIGIDPGPRRLPFLGRLALLFAVMPFHAFFGIATMTMTSTIGGNFYRSVHLPWLASISDDQHLGGAIAWGSSELPVIIVVIALVAQWARQDRRAATRADRHADSSYADDELDAYNAMLRELSQGRG